MTAVFWNGATGNWVTNPTDWNTGNDPAPGDDVTIGVGGSYTVSIVSSSVSVNSLTISDPGAVLAIDTIGGNSRVALTGSLSNSGRIVIGSSTLSQATIVSVVGFSNTGEIDLTGSASVQASLLVEPAAPTTLSGKFFLSGDALLAFESGAITAIGNSAELSLTGAEARMALGSAQGTNSALRQLGGNVGTLRLESGAVVGTTVDFLNNGVIDVDDSNGVGGSRLTIGGTLTNRGNIFIGNGLLPAATVVTTANLVNAGSINLTGGGAIRATLNVKTAAPSTFTGINNLTGDALLEYSSGAINNIVIGSTLSLNGPNARVALAGLLSTNSALKSLGGNAGTFNLENGAVVAISSGFTNTGLTEADSVGGAGGSLLTIGGTLSNSGHITIGNSSLSAATTVTAAGLSNTVEIDLTGARSVQATLDITGAAPATLTGKFLLTNDTLLEYGSGAITGIGSGATLSLNGATARVALASALSSNSALRTLGSNPAGGNLGTFRLDGGAVVTTTTDFSNGGLIQVDDSGTGNSMLTIGGTLTNNVAGGNGIKIGNAGLVASTLVMAAGLSNTGEVDLTGALSVLATLDITGAAPATLTGINRLTNDALLEYGSGAITAIGSGAALDLTGTGARVALAATPASNSALKSLGSNAGTLDLENGAVVATTGAFTNTGATNVDISGGAGGSRLTIGGKLTNNAGGSNGLKIGNTALSTATLVKAAGLSNTVEIDLTGARSVQATLNITGAAPATLIGINKLTNDALLEYLSGAITAIGSSAVLDLTGTGARVALAATPGSNSALTALASDAGTLEIDGGALVTTTVALSNTGFLGVDHLGAGGSRLTIGGTLSNSVTLDIGNSNLTQATTVTAAALANLSGGKVDIAGKAAPATLTLTGASTDAGTLEVDSGGVLHLGGSMNVSASPSPLGLTLNGGTISGGSLSGTGTIGSSISSNSTLNTVTIASGTTFAAGAGSTLTIDHVTVAGALTGGGSAGLVFGIPGTDTMTNISGFRVITLADGGANTLTLNSTNFTGNAITVNDGASGNTVNASTLSASDAIQVYAGIGADTLTGGAGDDVFFAAGLTTMKGNGGTNEFVFSGSPQANIITDFLASSTNEIVFSNFGFSLGLPLPGANSAPQALPSGLIGDLTTGAFTGPAQRFAYNQSTGQLLFDADGNGGGSASQLVATLTGAPALTASHLFFVT